MIREKLGKFAALAAFASVQVSAFGGTIEGDFKNPPPDARAETWWHFTTNHITKEGITRDLEAMKDIGYSAAHIFMANCYGKIPNVPDAQIMTPLWRGLMQHAGAEARRLGLSLGVHNCPGWSSSGGPWINPEDSMKCLVHTQKRVRAGETAPIVLPKPPDYNGFYRDIAVLALPAQKPLPEPKISSSPKLANCGKLSVGSGNSPCPLPIEKEGGKASIFLEYPETVEARTAEFSFEGGKIHFTAEIFASEDGKNFRKAGAISYKNPQDKGTPKFALLGGEESARGKFFRVDFSHNKTFAWESSQGPVRLKTLRLSREVSIDNAAAANSSQNSFAYVPPRSGAHAEAPAVSEIIDLTGRMSPDGRLDWKPEGGDWTILRIGYTSTGRKNVATTFTGLECDKLSKRGLDAHWPNYMAAMEADLGKGTLKYATIDSFEVGGQNWTEDFAAEFKKRRGYDAVKWLPAALGYAVESPAKSARFLYDFQRTVSDLFAENYFDYFTELCHKDGLLSILEAYGGPFDNLRCTRSADIPASEFWLSGGTTGRHAASAANFHGRRAAGAESFTTGLGSDGYWRQYPRMLKASGDTMWAEGTNALIIHSYVHQPFVNARPGLALGPHGSHINANTTWWNDGKAWVGYINRAQTLLQRGRTPSDALVLAGESQPNVRTRNQNYDKPLLEAGYFFDFCSSDDLADSIRLENGKIVAPSGVKYSAFSLGGERYPTLRTLKAVKRMLGAGISVCGERPLGSPSLSDDDAEYAKLVAEIWGADAGSKSPRKVGSGTLYPENSAARAVADLKIVPALKTLDGFRSTARSDADADIFFIANRLKSQNSGVFRLRSDGGKCPEIWDAATGEISPAPQWEYSGGSVNVALNFAPGESKFVVLRKGGKAAHFREFSPKLSASAGEQFPIEIIGAEYRARGSKGGGRDVKEILQKAAGAPFKVSNKLLGDPFPNKYKELYFKYRAGGREFEETLHEGAEYCWKGMEWKTPPAISPAIVGGKPAVVFGADGSAEGTLSDGSKFSVKAENLPKPIDLSSGWTVEFAKDLGAPEGKVRFEKLESWTERPEPGIKYFSGTAKYEKSFNVPPEFFAKNRRIILSLGEVRETARVAVNGKDAGVLWKIPYEADITELLKEGKNTVEVSATNLWYNRLVGDEINSPNDGINSPRQSMPVPQWVLDGKSRSDDGSRRTFTLSKGWDKNSKPEPSGLIGPVNLRAVEISKAE